MPTGDRQYSRMNDSVQCYQIKAPDKPLIITINLSLTEVYRILDKDSEFSTRSYKVSTWIRKKLEEEIESSNSNSELSKVSSPPKCSSPSPTYTGTGDMSPPTEFQVW